MQSPLLFATFVEYFKDTYTLSYFAISDRDSKAAFQPIKRHVNITAMIAKWNAGRKCS